MPEESDFFEACKDAEKKHVHLNLEVDARRLRIYSGRQATRCRSYDLPIVFQAILKLVERFINRFDCFHAVPAKIMGGMFQVILCSSKRFDRFADLGVGFRHARGCGRRLRSCRRDCCWGSRCLWRRGSACH